MKLGFVSAIMADNTLEEVIKFAGRQGYQCVEVACWPKEKAERRYAGVSHIDTENLNEEICREIKKLCQENQVEISALAYYPNILDENIEKAQKCRKHLYSVIDAAAKLQIYLVNTFIGRSTHKTVSENLELVKEVWPDILDYAAERNVKIAIENCPMYFTEDEWPGGQNLMTTPANWRKIFEILDSDNLGINYDPSHFVWQQIDYIRPLYEFADKIFHVHFKDIRLYQDKLQQVGVMATPLEYMAPKLPGLGDVKWKEYVSALNDIGYQGYACIEVEDKAFEDSQRRIEDALILSKRYLGQYII